MRRAAILRPFVFLLLLAASNGCAGSGWSSAAKGSSPGSVRVFEARARFNAAIANRDTTFISSILLPTYHSVSGRSSQRNGHDAAMQNWATAFRDTTLLYVRTPRTVIVNEQWGLAEEIGDWTGHAAAADGLAKYTGVYTAKWQRSRSGKWMLQAELFTTMSCLGGPIGCNPPDPVAP